MSTAANKLLAQWPATKALRRMGAEWHAREILHRAGVSNAHKYSTNQVSELADLIMGKHELHEACMEWRRDTTPRRFASLTRTIDQRGFTVLDAIDTDGRAWWLVLGDDAAPDDWTELECLPTYEAQP